MKTFFCDADELACIRALYLNFFKEMICMSIRDCKNVLRTHEVYKTSNNTRKNTDPTKED